MKGKPCRAAGLDREELLAAKRILLALAWIIGALLVVLLCMARCAQALPNVEVRPYIEVSYTPSEVHFSGITGPGTYDAALSMTVKVDTNANFGALLLDASQLTLVEPRTPPPGGYPNPNEPPATIPKSRLYVKATGMTDFAALAAPVVVMPARGPGHHEVVLYFRIEVEVTDPAGRYHGQFNLSVLPAP